LTTELIYYEENDGLGQSQDEFWSFSIHRIPMGETAMNTKTLKAAERKFLLQYPGGFKHPEMVELGKKHKMERLEALAKESFAKKNFNDPQYILDEAVKLVGRSTMVSMFEKPKFRDYAKAMRAQDKEVITEALLELLHGKEKAGFELFVDQLMKKRLAKWPLATVVQAYYRPQKEVFVKPTTAKLIIEKLELDLEYRPTPTWEFYRKFRQTIKEIKAKSKPNLAPNNPAFCGFLMMSLGDDLDP